VTAGDALKSPDLAVVLATAAAAFLAVLAGTGLLLRGLRRLDLLDRPNERSSHALPTPTGGGIAVTTVLVLALIVLWSRQGVAIPDTWPVIAPMIGLGLISWIDDVRNLGALPRLAAQIVAVACGIWALPGPWHAVSAGVPAWLFAVALGLAWVWFINLFNFMDGIDGIAGAETLVIGAGVAIVAGGLAGSATLPLWPAAIVTIAAIAGFLAWNWHPAKIFLGDVGSVPLGFLLGWLLLFLALNGQWAAAVILPLYYLADATVTLVKRLSRGERIWRAHRSHFYQTAVAAGRSHARVAGTVLAAGMLLIALAWLAARGWPIVALAGAGAVVLALLAWMSTRPR
jgi:UDP-N-acetylmuramyl pentapeptide phosphotransferase/UDP-N-acetylglucosamine-1-phosphate transferase